VYDDDRYEQQYQSGRTEYEMHQQLELRLLQWLDFCWMMEKAAELLGDNGQN